MPRHFLYIYAVMLNYISGKKFRKALMRCLHQKIWQLKCLCGKSICQIILYNVIPCQFLLREVFKLQIIRPVPAMKRLTL
jgi:hypothetical protein